MVASNIEERISMNIYNDTNQKNKKYITKKKLKLVEKAFEDETLTLVAPVIDHDGNF
jgi:hypothetical protein